MAKVVLITGGSSGIGKAVGEYLLNKNFIVYGTSRNASGVKNSKFPIVSLDVTKKETITSAVSEVIKKEGKLDVLVNNAGMGITGPIEETPTDEMRKVFETNFFGAIEVVKAVLPQMRKQKNGLIINVTSIAGYMGLPF
ncbi:MAG TPA: SDR family NAD(P)-dependent oxidoreductase, partial [Flavobacteriaceae bacterium]|nr:SDR family NAD(P)-dependent oxidoreductase [Flavobacteriaceae bacterium]